MRGFKHVSSHGHYYYNHVEATLETEAVPNKGRGQSSQTGGQRSDLYEIVVYLKFR